MSSGKKTVLTRSHSDRELTPKEEELAVADAAKAVSVLEDWHEREPENVDVAFHLGLVHLVQGHAREAESFFRTALAIDPEHADARHNLAVLLMSTNRIAQAVEQYEWLSRNAPNSAEYKNDLALALFHTGDPDRAARHWRQALRLNPNYQQARRNAVESFIESGLSDQALQILVFNEAQPGLSPTSRSDIGRWQKRLNEVFPTALPQETILEATPVARRSPVLKGRRIAILASIDSFVQEIVAHLAEHNEVRIFTKGSVERMKELMNWADLVWYECCSQLAIEGSKLDKRCQTVLRIHSYEVFTEYPQQVNWANIDHAIFVNDSVRRILAQRMPFMTPSTVIPNGLDLGRYRIDPAKRRGKKIASVGYINYKKNPALLLYCFKKIHAYDSDYTLHVAGEHQDDRIRVYWDHFLRENDLPVVFDGWVKDIPAWLGDKDYIISTSLFESFHYSIAEGMSCGLLPLIHNWFGAAETYPERYLFSDPDDCLRLLQELAQSDVRPLRSENRAFIDSHYGLEGTLTRLEELLVDVLAGQKQEASIN